MEDLNLIIIRLELNESDLSRSPMKRISCFQLIKDSQENMFIRRDLFLVYIF